MKGGESKGGKGTGVGRVDKIKNYVHFYCYRLSIHTKGDRLNSGEKSTGDNAGVVVSLGKKKTKKTHK